MRKVFPYFVQKSLSGIRKVGRSIIYKGFLVSFDKVFSWFRLSKLGLEYNYRHLLSFKELVLRKVNSSSRELEKINRSDNITYWLDNITYWLGQYYLLNQ